MLAGTFLGTFPRNPHNSTSCIIRSKSDTDHTPTIEPRPGFAPTSTAARQSRSSDGGEHAKSRHSSGSQVIHEWERKSSAEGNCADYCRGNRPLGLRRKFIADSHAYPHAYAYRASNKCCGHTQFRNCRVRLDADFLCDGHWNEKRRGYLERTRKLRRHDQQRRRV